MEYNRDKVDEMVLALLFLTSSSDPFGTRAWKGFNLEVLERLHRKGYINDPMEKSPTVTLSEAGADLSKKLFFENFAENIRNA
jgi:hypothetical protein